MGKIVFIVVVVFVIRMIVEGIKSLGQQQQHHHQQQQQQPSLSSRPDPANIRPEDLEKFLGRKKTSSSAPGTVQTPTHYFSSSSPSAGARGESSAAGEPTWSDTSERLGSGKSLGTLQPSALPGIPPPAGLPSVAVPAPPRAPAPALPRVSAGQPLASRGSPKKKTPPDSPSVLGLKGLAALAAAPEKASLPGIIPGKLTPMQAAIVYVEIFGRPGGKSSNP